MRCEAGQAVEADRHPFASALGGQVIADEHRVRGVQPHRLEPAEVDFATTGDAVVTTDALHAPLVRMLELTERVLAANPLLGAALFVLFAALSGVLAFFSSAVLVPVAVYTWGLPRSAALLWLGFPGFMSSDAQAQYAQALSGTYDNVHPPLMSWLWRQMNWPLP